MAAPQSPRAAECHVGHAALLVVLLCVGCSQETQFGAANYRLLASLHTAVSAKRTDWLDAAAKVIAERRTSGELDERQSTELEAIVAKARGGNWQGAESDIVRLQKGQRSPIADNRPPQSSGP